MPSDVPSTRPCVIPAERDTISNSANSGASGQGQLMSTDHQDWAWESLSSFREIHTPEGAHAAKSAAQISGKQSENSSCLELGWL